ARPLAGLRVHLRTGPLDARSLAELVPDFERWETWACGPPAMLDGVTSAFAARSAERRVRVERFSLDDAAGPGASSAPAPDGGEVTFLRSERRARGAGPLLAIAERAGLAPPSG